MSTSFPSSATPPEAVPAAPSDIDPVGGGRLLAAPVTGGPVVPDLDPYLHGLIEEVVRIRRDIHSHPEVGWHEVRTTNVIAKRLKQSGVPFQLLSRTGLTADITPPGWDHTVALRADIDALPLHDETRSTFVSRNPGVAHACGHDVHTAVVLGAGLVLAQLAEAGILRHRVRLIFQPAEETMPGGAVSVIEAGRLKDVDRILAVHCDPHLDVGHIGLRVGAITSASDHVRITVRGEGGHTSRPHLTQDLVTVLGDLITRVPAVLQRRLDARSAVNLVWGSVQAGNAANAIPSVGVLQGTLRCLDLDAWRQSGPLLSEIVEAVVATYGAVAELDHVPGVPPTVNEAASVSLQEAAAVEAVGPLAVVPTPQSMGGEDFAWYLEHVPGALARLGTRQPGGRTFDLHRGNFDPDERAVEVGIRFMVACALMSGDT